MSHSTVMDLVAFLQEQTKRFVEAIPSAERRKRLATNPEASIHHLMALALTNPEDVEAHPALQLLSLEEPAKYASMMDTVWWVAWCHQFFGRAYFGLPEEENRKQSCDD